MKIKEEEPRSLPFLCIKSPISGNIEGECCVCGVNTNEGHKKPFSNNFVGFSFLTLGDCVCPWCYAFFKEQSFRRKSWIATAETVVYLKRVDCLQYILTPPEPPFFIYITQSGQRQGWIDALRIVNYNRDNFYISTDWTGCFCASKDKIRVYYEIISILRSLKISKTAIRTGEYTMFQYKQILQQKYEKLLQEARKYVGEPLWEVMCYVIE